MITLILLAVWIPVSVLLGVIIGSSIRLADEREVGTCDESERWAA